MGAIEMMGPGKMGRVMVDTDRLEKAVRKGHKFLTKKEEAAFKKDQEAKAKKKKGK